jgi:hypothetical protein
VRVEDHVDAGDQSVLDHEGDHLSHIGARQQRLGQPLPDVVLAPPGQRTPRSVSSAADISSVTVGGVWLIASAYSITLRSKGVKAPDSRHRGTSRALSAHRDMRLASRARLRLRD